MRSSIAVTVALLAFGALLTVVARPQETPSDGKTVEVKNGNSSELEGLHFSMGPGGGGCPTCGMTAYNKPCGSCGTSSCSRGDCDSNPVYVYLMRHSRRKCGCNKSPGSTCPSCSSNIPHSGGCPYCQKAGGSCGGS